MIDKEAIQALQQGAAIAQASQAVGTDHFLAALPSDFKVHDLEHTREYRRRARGVMETSSAVSFAHYVNSHALDGCTVFMDPDAMKATAVLNLGTSDLPGQADNLARIVFKKTAAYSALLAVTSGQALKQVQVAEFLEDWFDHLWCFHGEEPLDTRKAIAAVRKITVEAVRKLESAEQVLSASRSAFESASASSTEGALPTIMAVRCEPYAGLPARVFSLRLSLVTTGDKPALMLRIVKHEEHVEAMGQEACQLLQTEFDQLPKTGVEDLPMLLGAYNRAS